VPTYDDGIVADIPNDHDVSPYQYVDHHHGSRFHHHLPDEHLDDHDVDPDDEHLDDHDVDLDDDNDRGAGAATSGVADRHRR
jgi:hypothetical protein